MRQLDDKVIVLAGGAGGIGGATARRLASEGAIVVIGDLNAADAKEIADEIVATGGRAISCALDVGDEESIKALMNLAVSTYRGIDGLHFNAAERSLLSVDTTVVDIDVGHWDYIQKVSLRGGMLCARYAIPEMLKRGGGSIVFTSSGASSAGEPVRVAYAAAKAGLNAIMRHVASAWGKQGIRSNAVAPGPILTPHHLKAVSPEQREERLKKYPITRLGAPEDIASMVALLMSAEGGFIQGQVIYIDGGSQFRG